jgi:MtN3 and saliva related transmembrane protein
VTDVLGVLAASWGVMMAISPVLQIRRILERRSSADISIGYLAVLQVGFILWILYGIALRNPAIFVPNGVATLVGAATIGVAFRFRIGAPTHADASARDAALEQAEDSATEDGPQPDADPRH